MAKNDLQGTLDLLVLSAGKKHLLSVEKDCEHLVQGVRAILRYA
jgi:hypothetical protein